MRMLALLPIVWLVCACTSTEPPDDLVGDVIVLRPPGADGTFLVADFFHDDGSTCAVSTVERCEIWECEQRPSANLGAIVATWSSGGSLRAELGDGDEGYGAYGDDRVLREGDTIRISTGGSSPLDATLAVPRKAALVSRSIEQNMPIDPRQDWTFDWQGGSDDGSIVVNLAASDALGFSSAACTYDAVDRHGVIPRAVLERVRERAITASLRFSSATRASPIDGGRVWFAVEDWMADADGQAADVLIRFE